MKALSVAERESLVAKVVTNGVFDIAEASALPDDELIAASEYKPDSILDPDTGHMDSDDSTAVENERRGLSSNDAAHEPPAHFPASIADNGGAFIWPSGLKGKPFWAARRFPDGSWAFATGETSGRAVVFAEELAESFIPVKDAKTFETLLQEADVAFLSRKSV